MLSQLLREVLFIVIHLVASVYSTVRDIYHRILSKKSNLSKGVSTNDLKVLSEFMPKIKKKLEHLVVLVDLDQPTLEDLAQVVIFSLVMNVPYVSFYDITGQLKDNEEKLFLNVERKKKGIPGCIKWSNKPNLNGYTNGNRAHTVNINIFTPKDGRPTIAQCVRQISEGIIPCSKETEEFTAQELDDALALLYPEFPEPDLVLYTSELCCTYGLLPWQIRFTEFIQFPKHNVSIESFIDVLSTYAKFEQRLGK